MRGRKPRPLVIPPADLTSPSAGRPERLPTLVPGPSGSHRAGQRPRRAEQHDRLPGAVRRGHRLEDLPPLRAAWPGRVAGSPVPLGPPRADFPPSSGPRSSNWPAWSRSPGACTSPTGPARTWPARRSPTASSRPSAPARSAGSWMRSISSRIAPATGGRPGSTPGSRSGPRRSSGATPTPSGWPSGASGSSAPTRCPTTRCSNATRSAGPSPARSSSRSSSTPGTARSTC